MRLFTLLFTIFAMTATAQPKDTILYVYDPMCGWCYGFDPVMEQVATDFADRLHFHTISGGMITGDRQGVIAPQMATYILNTVPRLEQMTGVKFGEAFLKTLRDGTYYASSVRPSRAMTVFRSLHPDKAVAFAHAMQRKLFLEGKSLDEDATYHELCKDLGLDATAFIQALNDPSFLEGGRGGFCALIAFGRIGFSGRDRCARWQGAGAHQWFHRAQRGGEAAATLCWRNVQVT
jgi:putative protein-disulfide isomerase